MIQTQNKKRNEPKRHFRNSNSSSPKPRPQQQRGNKESTLSPHLFEKRAIESETVTYQPTRKITDLPVNPKILANLTKKGYTVPTEIQDKSIEAILAGRDVIGIAQTGTGKTGAFLIPTLHHLLGKAPANQMLIVSPTRELAVQINDELKSISAGLGIFSTCLIGGTNLAKDLQNLRKPNHIIVGTPGRINDLARQRALRFDQFQILVLDEFDRLLDMGFYRDIQIMVSAMKNREQTVLFSATEDKKQKPIIDSLLVNPVSVRVSTGNVSGDHIDQETVKVNPGENKMHVLIRMLRQEEFKKVIVFADTKRWVKVVCRDLLAAGIKADQIHGNKSQNYRLQALSNFKKEAIQVLVATDVAARGLDISQVSHVINYQQPKSMDSYIHRIGRTGRAGLSGKAYTFIN